MKIEKSDTRSNNKIDFLILGDRDNHCHPCLAEYNKTEKEYKFINQPFFLCSPVGASSIIMVDGGDSLELEYVLNGITKKLSFYGDSFITFHDYSGYDNSNGKLELVWAGGCAERMHLKIT